MNELLERKSIWQHEIPPDTLEQWEQKMEKDRKIYGTLFKTDEELQLFCMLPLTKNQREEFLVAIHEEAKENYELKTCTGVSVSTPEHRSRCVKCCVTARPIEACPYY